MPQGKPRDPRKEQHWQQLLDRWQDSGLSVRAFCRRHGLAEPTFYAWRRTLAQRPAGLNRPLKVPGAAKACHTEGPTPSDPGALVVRAGVRGGRPFAEPPQGGLGVPGQVSAGSALAECPQDDPGFRGGDALQSLNGAQLTQLFRR
jgi:hypothetical protein